MSFTANQHSDKPRSPTRRAAGTSLTRVRSRRAGLVVVVLLGTGVLTAACGGGPSSQGVASLGTTTTTTGPSAAKGGGTGSPSSGALAFVNCMRAHGEPNMPEPVIEGRTANISITAGSGVDPSSPRFTAAYNTCRHLLPNNGVPKGNTITPADQAEYLKAVACMRSHGIPGFPDPVFRDNNVMFNSRAPIDANSSQYKSALVTCEKLVPVGRPTPVPAPRERPNGAVN